MIEIKDWKAWIEYTKLLKERPELFIQNGPIMIETDIKKVRDFENETGKIIGVVYSSKYSKMVVDLVYNENGKYYTYERLIPATGDGGIVTVPVFKDKFILIEQYRHSIRKKQLNFPRGFCENNLNYEEIASKEVYEETGAKTKGTKYLGEITADTGILSGKAKVYFCDIHELGTTKDTKESILNVKVVSKNELDTLIIDGSITDGYTLAAYNLYKLKMEENLK